MTNQKLGPGDQFPGLQLKIAGGDDIILPDGIETDYAFVLFYRGYW